MVRLLNRLRRISFRNFLMLFSLGAMLLLLLLLSSVLFMRVKHFIEEKKQFIVTTRMNQISFEINSSFSNVYFMLNNLKTNERLLGYTRSLRSGETDRIDKYKLSLDFEKYLSAIRQENAFIENILVITPQSQFSSDHTYLDFNLNGIQMRSELEKDSSFVPVGKANDRIALPKGASSTSGAAKAIEELDRHMFFSANLTAADGTNEGVIMILLDPNYFKDKIPYNEDIALYDASQHLIFGGAQTGRHIQGLETHETVIPFNGFRLVYAQRLDLYRDQLVLMIRLTVLTILLAIVVSFVSSRFISKIVLYPVYRLIRLFQSYDFDKGKLNYYQELNVRRKHLNLRDRLLVYFITTILLPLLVYMTIFYWQSSKIVAADLKKGYYSLFEKTNSLLEHDINQIEVLIARISLDKTVQEYLLDQAPAKLEKQLLSNNQFLGFNRNVISLYDRSNQLMFSNRYKQAGELDPVFYSKMKASGRVISYHLTKDDLGNIAIVLGMPIIPLDKYPAVAGYVTVELDSGYFSNLYAEFKQNGNEAFIADMDNRIVSHPISSQAGKAMDFVIPDGDLQQVGPYGEYFVSAKKIPGVPWRFVSRYNYSDVEQQVINLFLSDSYLVFLIFLLMLLFAYYMSQRMLKPLGKLNAMLNAYELGESHRMIADHTSGIDEVDLLGRNFNHMVRRIDDLVHETIIAGQERIRLEYEKKESQMIALQSQINPHFLYNTLENLIHLVETKEVEKAVGMINSLSRLFRYITNREQKIRMRDEITYAKTYASIMSQRYDNFECVWRIDVTALECSTMKLILQPIIENAIHHGARKTRRHVTIDISCLLREDRLYIVVKDNAAGMPENKLAEVRALLADPEITKAGIYNVNARIKLNFGEAYGLDIESKYGEGTKATIVLPADY